MVCPITLQIAALLIAAGVVLSALACVQWPTALLFFLGALCMGLNIFETYIDHWPYTPMYMNSRLIVLFLGTLCPVLSLCGKWDSKAHGLFIGLTMLLFTSATLFFPKDYYMPNIRSASIWSHLYSLADPLGRAIFIASATDTVSGNTKSPLMELAFTFFAIAIFSGMLFSINGLGTPISFHQPEVIGFMFIWFLCLLISHAQWTRFSPSLFKALHVSTALLTILVTIKFDLGVWRPLW